MGLRVLFPFQLFVFHCLQLVSFRRPVFNFPFCRPDYILVGLWVLLLVLGVWWQFHRSKGQPHFPNQHRPRRRNRPHIRDGTIPPPPIYDEHSPLLGSQYPPPSYQESVNASQQRPAEMNYPSWWRSSESRYSVEFMHCAWWNLH